MATELTLYYFHDPMCSWCWGYRPSSQKLFAALPKEVKRVNVLGGLAPDSDEPMTPAMREAISGHWRRIEAMFGTRFNHDFWTQCEPRRSTYPACRAVLAASRQAAEEQMILAIQQAYYQQARNPSDVSVLCELAGQSGLDEQRFLADIHSAGVEAELQRQLAFTRSAPITGFPSLVLEVDDQPFPIRVDYKNHEMTLDEITRIIGN
jgi:putative protein-disulfide isomerase